MCVVYHRTWHRDAGSESRLRQSCELEARRVTGLRQRRARGCAYSVHKASGLDHVRPIRNIKTKSRGLTWHGEDHRTQGNRESVWQMPGAWAHCLLDDLEVLRCSHCSKMEGVLVLSTMRFGLFPRICVKLSCTYLTTPASSLSALAAGSSSCEIVIVGNSGLSGTIGSAGVTGGFSCCSVDLLGGLLGVSTSGNVSVRFLIGAGD